jgi:hypothetical protein
VPPCKYNGICHRDADEGDDYCILHSEKPDKDRNAFSEAFAEHRKHKLDFSWFVFPGPPNFGGFNYNRIYFRNAKFLEGADFGEARFDQEAYFEDSQFPKGANFRGANFVAGADFSGALFKGGVDFSNAKFAGKTFFRGREGRKIFRGVEVSFTDATIKPLDALVIRDADLQRCRFLGTDLRKAEITNVEWPEIGKRNAVYDEKILLTKNEIPQYQHLERLYRELKQNYEDRRDYERMSDFHYGEKEMRRQNTKGLLRFALRTYRCLSGYGEDFKRAFFCVLALAAICAFLFWCLGFCPQQAVFYSLRVMLHLKPEAIAEPAGWGVGSLFVVESILGPVLIGLFGLALRQRLKR